MLEARGEDHDIVEQHNSTLFYTVNINVHVFCDEEGSNKCNTRYKDQAEAEGSKQLEGRHPDDQGFITPKLK